MAIHWDYESKTWVSYVSWRERITDFIFGFIIVAIIYALFIWAGIHLLDANKYVTPLILFLIILISAFLHFKKRYMAFGMITATVLPILLIIVSV